KEALSFINKRNTTLLLLAIIVIIPITIPYFSVSKEFSYVRDIRDTIHFALQPEDLIVSDKSSRLYEILNNFSSTLKYPSNAEIKPGFIGLSLSILLILSFIHF